MQHSYYPKKLYYNSNCASAAAANAIPRTLAAASWLHAELIPPTPTPEPVFLGSVVVLALQVPTPPASEMEVRETVRS
jgi:hypothetical protein